MTGDHGTPSYKNKGREHVALSRDFEVFEKISDRIEEDSPCCYGEAPEIESLSPFKRSEDLDVEFEEVVECHAEEDDHSDLQHG